MQVLCPFMRRYLNKITASISLRVSWVNSANCMKRLMDITDEVNEESQSIWEFFFIRKMRKLFHHGDVHKILMIALCLWEPINQSRDDLVYRKLVKLEPRIIFYLIPFIQVRSVNKVPTRLESSSLCLDLVSKSSALHKRILAFMRSHSSIGSWINLQKFICLLQCFLPLVSWLEIVESNLRHY